MTVELTRQPSQIIHIEASQPTTREQLQCRLELNIGMIAVIDAHITELQENPTLYAAQIDSRNRQKQAYEIEQRNLRAQIDML